MAESVLSHKFTRSGRALLDLETRERRKPVRISEFNLGSGRGDREELILDYWKKKALAANPDEPEADDRDYRTEVTGRREYHLQDIVGHDRPKNGKWKGKLMLQVTYQGYSRDEVDLKTLEAAFSMRPKLVARYLEKNGIALSRQYSQQLANDSDTSDDDDQSDDEDEDDGDSQDVEGDKAGATQDVVEVPDSQVVEAGANKDIVEVPDSQAQAN